MQTLIELTAQGLKGQARSSLEKTILLLQKFHVPLDILGAALIDYTAEFCVKTGCDNAPDLFVKAFNESKAEWEKRTKG